MTKLELLWCLDFQHDDTQNNDTWRHDLNCVTQHNSLPARLSDVFLNVKMMNATMVTVVRLNGVSPFPSLSLAKTREVH